MRLLLLFKKSDARVFLCLPSSLSPSFRLHHLPLPPPPPRAGTDRFIGVAFAKSRVLFLRVVLAFFIILVTDTVMY